jgi:hypothetical protein
LEEHLRNLKKIAAWPGSPKVNFYQLKKISLSGGERSQWRILFFFLNIYGTFLPIFWARGSG